MPRGRALSQPLAYARGAVSKSRNREEKAFSICDMTFVIVRKSPNEHWALDRDRFWQ